MSNSDSGRPSRLPYTLALLALGVLVLFAWTSRGRYVPVIAGAAAPHFTAQTLEGEEVSLADYEGKVILLNIWATWCPPCREEMPSMQRLRERVEEEDFEIVAVSVDAAVRGQSGWGGQIGGDVGGFIDELGLSFDVLWDPTGEIANTYQTTGLPESFLIGRDGVVYKRLAGATAWDAEAYVEQIRRLLSS
ncbi:MAG: TlpA disulfide reductase family protein [Longimicrobiales bacterium]|nr:TlpA disulfide reductase family protein [Longimicrobiales bacterium]